MSKDDPKTEYKPQDLMTKEECFNILSLYVDWVPPKKFQGDEAGEVLTARRMLIIAATKRLTRLCDVSDLPRHRHFRELLSSTP